MSLYDGYLSCNFLTQIYNSDKKDEMPYDKDPQTTFQTMIRLPKHGENLRASWSNFPHHIEHLIAVVHEVACLGHQAAAAWIGWYGFGNFIF
jgi:hypothetical protein